MDSRFKGDGSELAIPVRTSKVPPEDQVAMAVMQDVDGLPKTEIGKRLGYSPSTVAAQLKKMKPEMRRLIGTMASLEQSGLLNRVVQKYLTALLSRDPNTTDEDGRYMMTVTQIKDVVGMAIQGFKDVGPPAGLIGESSKEGAATVNPIAALLNNSKELERVTRSMTPGSKVRLSQSLEVESDDSPGSVDADFEVN